ncbi:unnamed protein product [Penicillium salamii]|uniref:Mg2+ transporter protein, CorA-like/Zinc transport protein ZntB n=1 Tax=Penicillium salamii TaxID=1612424 RepID=A0A9W4NZQ6_9EURO|nr:unnamed protein product [Penicillium salamii]CAG8177838.1 unnamed protein product [Penicillium salamii]CAG8429065.1 unnamed protein product [Penicillium salamii]CAG8430159.1 unnamed protein product [Penicillium salamii]CAG8898488.1 unnamed protein product [Penicillium salamii]
MDAMQEKGQIDSIPDRFSFYSSKTKESKTSSTWDDLFPIGHKEDLPLEKYKTQPNSNHPIWWIDVRDPTEGDVDAVAQALSIHPLTTEDIVMREPREKVDVFKNYYLLSLQTLVASKVKEERPGIPVSAALYMLVFQYGVVTFSPSGSSHVHRARDRISKMHDPSILTSDWVCYAMIDDIIDSFEPFTRDAERESEAIEDQVFIARIDDAQALIPQVDVLRKRITHIIRCLHGKVDVLNGFVKRCQSADKHSIFPGGDILLYLGDVQDHLVTTLSTLSHIDEIIGRSQANCLAQLSATNLRLSLTINSGLSKVTLLATIFVPCHLITGMWGMNVNVPGQEAAGLGWFFGIVGVFAAFMVICVAAAVKYKLL